MICTLCTTNHLRYGTLCADCTLTTRELLQRLPRMWASLEVWLTPGTTGTVQYGGRVRPAEAPLPVSAEVLDLRAAGGIAGVLEDWSDAIRQARRMQPRPRTGGLAHRVRAAAADLLGQIHFIALWDQGPQLGRELQQLVHRIQAAAQPPEPHKKGTLLGTCIAVDQSGIVCGAELWAQPGQRVSCSWCLCPYPPERWLALLHHQPGNDHDDSAEPIGQATAA
ncbi:hypothetical protein [Streptomyces sp. NBC_00620]|uniref:hypothetical protein n=1 Tax=Streptomyces sp. NBC_00620 TaxID=2903666 RepID=UPI0022510D7F|nr:hypothetical protein [Streptomyces sp. NBC_00620]MCX4974254.1 hypothetical protein [Streptomyces sp. NBC_00620]